MIIPKPRLAIYSTATTGYTYALEAQARKVVASIFADERLEDSNILINIVTDNAKDKKVLDAVRVYKNALPKASINIIADRRFGTGYKNYEREAQLLIAQMRTAATASAIAWKADYSLSLDCDILPPPNAIRCMIDMLEFDNGYYGAAFCPYPSHSGGPFMSGRGSPQCPIFPDFYEDERDIPEAMEKKKTALIEKLGKTPEAKRGRLLAALQEIGRIVMTLPPRVGLFATMARGWRRRGWFDFAYPAIGKGSCVPVDWTGFGCLMCSKHALSLCDWVGYEGRGTEDLFINYQRWHANGIKIVTIPHCPCDHIVRKPGAPGHYVHIITYHEEGGEFEGHLRQRTAPWHPHAPGERSNKKNDGSLHSALAKKTAKKKPSKRKRPEVFIPIKRKPPMKIIVATSKKIVKKPVAKKTAKRKIN